MIDQKDKNAFPIILYTKNVMVKLANILGILCDSFEEFDAREKNRHLKHIGLTADMIQDMIQERLTARKNKEFKRADEIREKFLEKGIVLLDTPKGTEWRIKHILTLKGEQ